MGIWHFISCLIFITVKIAIKEYFKDDDDGIVTTILLGSSTCEEKINWVFKRSFLRIKLGKTFTTANLIYQYTWIFMSFTIITKSLLTQMNLLGNS